MRGLSIVAAIISLGAYPLHALTLDHVRDAAVQFAARGRTLGATLGTLPTAVKEHRFDEARCFSVRMYGGGTVFLAEEAETASVVAFTSNDLDLDTLDDRSPLKALLKRDAQVRVSRVLAFKVAEASMATTATMGASSLLLATTSAGRSEPGDVRVAPLVESQWSQDYAYGKKCYNHYTPSNYVCGCVATAMSQVMRSHRYPDSARVVTHTNVWLQTPSTCERLTLSTSGETYDWEQMPLKPASGVASNQCQQIGRLCSDVGIAVDMEYTYEGSGAYSCLVAGALTNEFRYAQARFVESDYYYGLRPGRIYERAIYANLDAGLPVIFGICMCEFGKSYNGHEIVADGYGYVSDTAYVHLNFGWAGQSDLWYNLPEMSTASYAFNTLADITFNIMPFKTGAVLSGRVLECDGKPSPNAAVRVKDCHTDEVLATTNVTDSGVYAFILPAGDYSLEAVSADLQRTNSLTEVTLTEGANETVTASAENLDGSDLYITYDRVKSNNTGNSWGNVIMFDRSVTNFYVSAENGSDEIGDGSEENPYRSITNALARQRFVNGDTIYVKPGRYYGCVETPPCSVNIISTEGPEVTFIDGEKLDYCYYGVTNPDSLISGFTLENGIAYCGAGVCCGTVSNCVIRFCSSAYKYHGESYPGGGAYKATLYDTVLYGNVAFYGGGAGCCKLYHCTVYDNFAYTGGGVDCDCEVYDSLVWRNRGTEDGENFYIENWETYGGKVTSFANSCTYPSGFTDLGGSITNDPHFVSLNKDDWRLKRSSPCLKAASDGLNMGAWQGEGVYLPPTIIYWK